MGHHLAILSKKAQYEQGVDLPVPRMGLIVNPIAGMGGAVGLKGTDGSDVLREAEDLGAEPLAQHRAKEMLEAISRSINQIELITVFSESFR